MNRDKTTQAPEGMMSAVLSNNIGQRGSGSEFVRPDGRFGLNRAGGRAASDAADRPLSGPAAAGQNHKRTGATS